MVLSLNDDKAVPEKDTSCPKNEKIKCLFSEIFLSQLQKKKYWTFFSRIRTQGKRPASISCTKSPDRTAAPPDCTVGGSPRPQGRGRLAGLGPDGCPGIRTKNEIRISPEKLKIINVEKINRKTAKRRIRNQGEINHQSISLSRF